MSSAFQPRYGEDAYPIGRLILDRARTLSLSRADLVRRLGYQNLSKGHLALATLLLTGVVPANIAQHLAAALDADQDLIDGVLRATAQQRHDEARTRILESEHAYQDAFRPHLLVQTERRVPSPIFIAALLTTERLRIVRLPEEAFTGSEDDRDQFIKRTIVEHHRREHGWVPAFGGITGYILVLIPGYGGLDFGLPFDVHGDRAGPMRKVQRLPEAILTTKRGHSLAGLLRNTPIQVIPLDQMDGHP